MKTYSICFQPRRTNTGLPLVVMAVMMALVSPFQASLGAADTEENDGDRAWKAVEKASRPPAPPEAWQQNRPSKDEVEKFRAERARLVGEAADKAKEFYTKFPDHARAADARKKEYELTLVAVQLGDDKRLARLEVLEGERLKDPSLSEDDRFELRSQAVQRAVMSKQSEGMAAVLAEFEKGARALQKDFPKRDEVYALLLEVASSSSGDKARQLAQEILDGPASTEVKEGAKGLLKKMDAVGKPVDISFTAADGRKVDVSTMKDKVVLIDFWATWCGPCVAEIPNVVAAFEKLHPKGFEIIGISFDEDKEALEKFVAKNKMTWPQFFDGKGWQNKFGREFGINGIPTMWLVDKKGNLRDLNGREDLTTKVEKMLAE